MGLSVDIREVSPKALWGRGAVATNDDKMAEQLSLLRNHRRNKEGEVVACGTNSRLDNIQAAVLDLKLKAF